MIPVMEDDDIFDIPAIVDRGEGLEVLTDPEVIAHHMARSRAFEIARTYREYLALLRRLVERNACGRERLLDNALYLDRANPLVEPGVEGIAAQRLP
jgi:hypothetical protein